MKLDKEKIFKTVDELSSETIMEVLNTLISIDTTVPPADNYREYVDTIKPYFEALGYECEEVVMPEELVEKIPYEIEGPRINLVARRDFGQEKDISFYGHMDVVPAPNEGKKKWRFPPFQASIIKSGKIYGRGTSDMKGSMACLILALQLIKNLELEPRYNIRIFNCTDEELGVYPGIRYLKEQGYIKGIVFCMEGVISPIIPVGAAGALNVHVKTHGRSCHSGMNFLGVNALEEMIPILNELMKLKKIVENRESEDIPGFPRFGSGEKRNMTPMFNLDIIQSGSKPNIVPDLCTLTINRRIIPDEDFEAVKKEIQDAIDRGAEKSAALDVTTEFIHDYPSLRVDPHSPAIQKIREVIQAVQGISEDKIMEIGSAGSTDMGFLTDYDIIIRGVGNPGSNNHAVNEYIRMRDVKTYIKELIMFLCGDL